MFDRGECSSRNDLRNAGDAGSAGRLERTRATPSDDLAEVTVLGAGVVGVATAYAFARRGAAVTIIDRAEEAGRGTSFANGAQLSYAYSDAFARPAVLIKLPMLMLGLDPAFRLHWRADPDMLRWTLAFLRNCTAKRFEINTLEMLRLALESRLAMHALIDRHPFDFGHRVAGKLHLYESRDAFAAACSVLAAKRVTGISQSALTPKQAVQIEPALASIGARLAGAVYSPGDEVGDPYLFCRALMALLEQKYAVRSFFHTAITGIDLSTAKPRLICADGKVLRTQMLVLCTGVDSQRLLRETGLKIPIWPMKGYSFTASAGKCAPRVSITDVARKLVFCNLEGRLRVAGLAELGNFDTAVNPRRFATLLEAARASLPEAAQYDLPMEQWAGLRAMTASSFPLITAPRPGIILNVGHSALGWTTAMGAGERAAMLAPERAQ